MEAKGYVTLVSEKNFGGTLLHSFRINTEDRFFRTGDVRSNISKNDYIKFSYSEKNGNYNVDVRSIERANREESSTDSPANKGASSVQRDLTKDDYWRGRELRDVAKDKYFEANNLRIQYQSARNAAISVVDVLVRDKILKLSDGAKADNVSVVLGKIDDLTDEFFHKCSLVGGDSELPGDDSIPFVDKGTASDSADKWS